MTDITDTTDATDTTDTMSSHSSPHLRKRDLLWGLFRPPKEPTVVSPLTSHAPARLARPTSSFSTPIAATPPESCLQAQSTAPPSRTFLEEALLALAPKEQAIIKNHVAADVDDISVAMDQAYVAAQHQKRFCEDKRWKLAIRGRTVYLRDEAEKVIGWLDRLKSLGDTLADIEPIYVRLPWSGISLLLKMALSDNQQMAALLTGMGLALAATNRLQAYFAYFQRLLVLPTVAPLTLQTFKEALIKLYSHVLQFLAEAISTYERSAASRIWRVLWESSTTESFETECDKLGARTEIEAANCDRELSAEDQKLSAQHRETAIIWKQDLDKKLEGINEFQKSLNDIATKMDALQVKSDLARLATVNGAMFNSYEEGHLSQCLPGTRTELLRQIIDWVDDSNSKNIFWLCGMAGSGKSTISRTVAEELHKRVSLGGSFFFKRGERDRGNGSRVFPTLAKQLANIVPGMSQSIAKALDTDPLICDRNLQEQFEKLLSQPLLDATRSHPANLPSHFVIVIDALDECERENDIRTILRLLAQLRMRVFVTSRPDVPIQLGFRNINGDLHHDMILEEVQSTTIEHDIRMYLNHRFTEIRDCDAMDDCFDPLPPTWPGDDKIEVLVGLAAPLFIFAATACRYISGGDPKKRLSIVLQQNKTGSLSTGLDEIYIPILDQLIMNLDEEPERALADFRHVVGSIALLADPLSIVPLSELLEVSVRDIKRLLRHLQSVLYVPTSTTSPIRLLHLSFRDFLVNGKNHRFRIHESQTHAALADQCIRRLMRPGTLHDDLCKTREPGVRRSNINRERVEECIASDVAYACQYWLWHVVESSQEMPLRDNSRLYDFLAEHFLHWLEALSWLGRLSSAIYYVGKLKSLVKGEEGSQLLVFLNDAHRFLLQNRWVIDCAPLQVYHSALSFLPERSVIRHMFENRSLRQFNKLPQVPLEWSPEIQTLENHKHSVTALTFSPDGETIASGSCDQTVRLWNARTGEEMQKLEGHNADLNAIMFSPDGETITSASEDSIVRSWNAHTGEEIQKLEVHGDIVFTMDDSPEGHSAFAMADSVIYLSHRNVLETTQLKGHKDIVNCVVFSPDGRCLASASADNTIRLWNVQTGTIIHELEGHSNSVTTVMFASDGNLIASASGDSTIRLWDVLTGEPIKVLEGHNDGVNTIDFSSDGEILTSGSQDNTVRLWRVRTGEQIHKLEGHIDSVNSVSFSPDNKIVASGSSDTTICLWNVRTGDIISKLTGHADEVQAVTFSSDGEKVGSGSSDRTIRLWNVQTGDQVLELVGHDGIVFAVELTSEGKVMSLSTDQTTREWDIQTGKQTDKEELSRFKVSLSSTAGTALSTSLRGGARLWDLKTGKQKLEFKLPTTFLDVIAISQDGKKVALASRRILQLWDTCTETMHTLDGHDNDVKSIAFSLDSKLLASGSVDCTVRLWTSQTGEEVRVFEGHGSEVHVLAFSPDGGIVAAGSNGIILLWNTRNGEQVQKFEGHKWAVLALAFSPDGNMLASGAADETIRLWDVMTDKKRPRPSGHHSQIRAIAFSQIGDIVATTSTDGSIRLWSYANGNEMYSLQGHERAVKTLAFSTDGTSLVSGSYDGSVRLWNLQGREQLQKFELQRENSFNAVAFFQDSQTIVTALTNGAVQRWDIHSKASSWYNIHDAKVNSVAVSPDSNLIASAANDHTVRLYDRQRHKTVWKHEGHDAEVSVVFSPDGKGLAMASLDHTVRLVNAETGEEMYCLHHDDGVNSVVFSPDGDTLVSGSKDHTVRVWNARTGEEIIKLKGHNRSVNAVAFSPSGDRIASASDDQTIRLWNPLTGEQIYKVKGDSEFNTVAFSPNAEIIASGSTDHSVQLWNLEKAEEVQRLKIHTGKVNSVAFSPDGLTLASASSDQTVRLWNPRNGKEIKCFSQDGDECYTAALSHNNELVASALLDGTVTLWNTCTGDRLWTLKEHTAWIVQMAFSPDGESLATASVDRTIRLWNTRSGQGSLQLTGHTEPAFVAIFSPDGQIVASGSRDETVRLWDARTGKELHKFEGHTARIDTVAFSPDGKILASASFDHTIRLWDISSRTEALFIKTHRTAWRIAFSDDGDSLLTDIGTFSIRRSETGPSYSVKLELGDQWIRYEGRDILWLPLEYRGECSAAFGSTIVVGQNSGAVSFFEWRDTLSDD